MNLWQAILWFTVKYLFLAGVAFAAIMLGIALRKRHDKKYALTEEDKNAELHS